ncbi:MAG: protein-disulfide reductase DsbD [Xanthomonadaceae bacterium]|nr:protein-disulfide reductase DsbD [Xanthomonadaceae bacterium]MDE2247189.1 protein-disulfide reductase DsbD [Xanthomonadaceae bacterium]
MRLFAAGRSAARLLAWLALLLLASPACAQGVDDLLPVTQAYQLKADAGTPGVLKLHWTIAPDYYLYRGRMKFTAGAGVTLGAAQLPDGEKHHDAYLGDIETYHHSVDASVPYTLAPGTTRLRLAVQYQGCHEVDPKICYPPHTEQIDLPLPASAGSGAAAANPLSNALAQLGSTPAGPASGVGAAPLPAEQAFRLDALAQSPHQLLLRWTMAPGYYLYRDQTTLKLRDAGGLSLQPAWPAGTAHHDEHFGDVTVYFDQVELPVAVQGDLAGRHRLTVDASFQGCQLGGLCYPLMNRSVTVDITGGGAAATAAAPAVATAPVAQAPLQMSLLAALLLALGGGLVLNLMPCVLPVLSIKAVSVIESGENPARRRSHALAYTAGVLSSFVALGLTVIALAAAWGTQLQYSTVVAALSLVMLTAGLWMSGVVQFGSSLGNLGSSLANKSGWRGDFFVGVLAVVVATPCMGPFMGPALGYALAAPAMHALLVFFTLGLGLALPFLVIGFVPAVARLLPRPGAWMETLKQALAFPMYLSAAWLAWVLANQRGADAVGLLMAAAVLLAMTLWWFERSRSRGARSRMLVVVLALLTAIPLYALVRLPTSRPAATVAADGVVAFTPARLAELRKAGTPVFVDMTADWCITCKANEHAVLDTDAFHDLLERTGTVYMKGDWTDVDPAISTFLQQYHSPGVPLYVVFPKGGGPGRQLSTVLTTALVEQALTEAAR